MRLDLETSLAPAPRTFSSRPRMWRVAARPRMPTNQRAGVSEGSEAPAPPTIDHDMPSRPRRPSEAYLHEGLDGCYGELVSAPTGSPQRRRRYSARVRSISAWNSATMAAVASG